MREALLNFTIRFLVISTMAATAQVPDAKPNNAIGTYVNQASAYDVLELREDSSFTLTRLGQTSGGKYTIKGNEITFMLPTGRGDKAAITGNTIRFGQGTVWVRRTENEKPQPEAAAVAEPEFNGEFRYFDPQTHALTTLERHDLALGGHGTIISHQVTYEVAGSPSPVRIGTAQPQEFIVRLAIPDGVDPSDFIKLYALKSTRKGRQLVVGKFGAYRGSKIDRGEGSTVSITMARYGAGSFKIAPVAPLTPGEYMLSAQSPHRGFLFGVD
jgi:hypothetical protein